MTNYPLSVDEIVSWYESKKKFLEGSGITVANIRHGEPGSKPAAVADFYGATTMGQISGWVSGEFDFHALRVSDGKDVFWRHVNVTATQYLETTFSDFLSVLRL